MTDLPVHEKRVGGALVRYLVLEKEGETILARGDKEKRHRNRRATRREDTSRGHEQDAERDTFLKN